MRDAYRRMRWSSTVLIHFRPNIINNNYNVVVALFFVSFFFALVRAHHSRSHAPKFTICSYLPRWPFSLSQFTDYLVLNLANAFCVPDACFFRMIVFRRKHTAKTLPKNNLNNRIDDVDANIGRKKFIDLISCTPK